jgi:glycosyltransferase involved in cell wall biosynthesis
MRLSVVIPTLRRHDTLRHALASVLAQTYPDLGVEWIKCIGVAGPPQRLRIESGTG